jgi:hypothetical protein
MGILRVIGLSLVAAMFLSIAALTQEKKIKRSDLPPAVEKTVAAQSQGATIRGFSQEKEKGQTFYEAELMVKGHSKDVLMEVNGVIVEVEEESITKHGKLVAYEAQVVINGKRSEVQVGPDGRPLDHEE